MKRRKKKAAFWMQLWHQKERKGPTGSSYDTDLVTPNHLERAPSNFLDCCPQDLVCMYAYLFNRETKIIQKNFYAMHKALDSQFESRSQFYLFISIIVK